MITISRDKYWQVVADSKGILFSFKNPEYLASRRPRNNSVLEERIAIIRLLDEQGVTEPIHGGVKLPWQSACQLETSARESLELPPPWAGSLVIKVQGLTHQNNFDIFLQFVRPNNKEERGIQTSNGGLIVLGEECYLASELQLLAIEAFNRFKDLKVRGQLDQFTSLSILQELRQAKARGLDINLNAYDSIEIVRPDAVRVAIEEQPDGGLILTPDLCQKDKSSLGAETIVDPIDFENRYENFIKESQQKACVPVRNKLVLLDEKTINGVREIIRNQHISPKRKESFLKNPTAWLSAEYVNLDLGFSNRVRGAAPLKVAYFGETDGHEIKWFEPKETPFSTDGSGSSETTGPGETSDTTEETPEPVILDIELSDEGDAPNELWNRPAPARNQISDKLLDQSKLLREPYPHQELAVRWLMSLSMSSDGSNWKGALLADDMGLGKTFSVLAFLREYVIEQQSSNGSAKPCLIVAPVSLLSVWKEELIKSLNPSPFSDPVILHNSEDLPRFRKKGGGREVGAPEPEANAGESISGDDLEKSIRYSLRIAENNLTAGPDCLGLANSIIITNYETVRDYQFSLARIPWSIAVFDEAQAIKNPNAMTTRAAKALNADFSVVMTGTPVENSLKDFWCLMDRAQPGFLNNYQPFRKEYITPIINQKREGNAEETVRVRNEIGEKLRDRVGGLMLRRLKTDHLDGLPKKEIILYKEEGKSSSGYNTLITCDMPKAQKEAYDRICLQAEGETEGELDSTSTCILAAIHHLKTASLHPDLITQEWLPHPKTKNEAKKELEKSGKLSKLLEILESIQKANEKVLIFAINKKLQVFLQSALQAYFKLPHIPGIINGDTKIKQSNNSKNSSRHELIESFSQRKGFDILILSPVAAGVGLTITAANHVVHLERHWNPAKEAQATDRVYRIGQEKPVTVWIPILKHPEKESFDEKLDLLLSIKSGLSEAVVTPEEVDPSELLGLIGGTKTIPPEVFFKANNLRTLKWDLFEALVAVMIDKDGANKVILTQAQSDKGCDVVVIGWRGKNWLIQCKHKSNPKGIVGNGCVREIVGSRRYYEKKLGQQFDQLAVFSNVDSFDGSAKEFSQIEKVDLFGNKEFRKLIPKKGIPQSAVLLRNNQREKV